MRTKQKTLPEKKTKHQEANEKKVARRVFKFRLETKQQATDENKHINKDDENNNSKVHIVHQRMKFLAYVCVCLCVVECIAFHLLSYTFRAVYNNQRLQLINMHLEIWTNEYLKKTSSFLDFIPFGVRVFNFHSANTQQ